MDMIAAKYEAVFPVADYPGDGDLVMISLTTRERILAEKKTIDGVECYVFAMTLKQARAFSRSRPEMVPKGEITPAEKTWIDTSRVIIEKPTITPPDGKPVVKRKR